MQEAVKAVIVMLAPIVPHMCHELWQHFDAETSVEDPQWPEVDNSALIEDEKLVIVQVNGKLRAKLTVPADITQADIENLAMQDENVSKFTVDKTVRKVIYVPGKLLNIVAN